MTKRTDHDTVSDPEDLRLDAAPLRPGRSPDKAGTPEVEGDRPTDSTRPRALLVPARPVVRAGPLPTWRDELDRLRLAWRMWQDPYHLSRLRNEMARLQAERDWLLRCWRRCRAHADLLAAAQAALGASAEDEPGAWAYLADEVSHQTGRDHGGFTAGLTGDHDHAARGRPGGGLFGDEGGWRCW